MIKSLLHPAILYVLIFSLCTTSLRGQKNEPGFEAMNEIIQRMSKPCPEVENPEAYKQIIIPQFMGTKKQVANLVDINQKAREGDAEAQYQMGRIYLKGKSIKQSYYDAAQWFSKAASQHHSKAAYEMAMLVESDYPHDQMLMSRYLILGLEDKKNKLENDTLWVKGNEYFESEKYDLSSTYLKILLEKHL